MLLKTFLRKHDLRLYQHAHEVMRSMRHAHDHAHDDLVRSMRPQLVALNRCRIFLFLPRNPTTQNAMEEYVIDHRIPHYWVVKESLAETFSESAGILAGTVYGFHNNSAATLFKLTCC